MKILVVEYSTTFCILSTCMRNVYLLMVFWFSCVTLYAQETDELDILNEEDEIIDNLLSEGIMDDVLQDVNSKIQVLYFSLDYNNQTYFSGRDIGINQFTLTPQITYLHSNGIFAGISGMYFSEFDPKWDYGSVTVGYNGNFDAKKIYQWSVSYDRYFFSDPGNNPFKNGFNVGLEAENQKKTFGTDVTTSILFGEDTSWQVISSTYGQITLFKSSKHHLKFRPQLRLIIAQQTIQLSRTFTFRGRQFTRYFESDDFGLLNTQVTLPLQYSFNNFDFEAGYIVNFPSPLEGESNLNRTGTFMFSVGYLLGL
ncbi:conserved hypothetical protein [Tenacibaculum sp. 190524A02b]|uniref:Uncharacterized protein n=2 Tax=Tenacibaculum vairaonense TaxID=3137860 RepID=A0ABM9PM53_9FLAO